MTYDTTVCGEVVLEYLGGAGAAIREAQHPRGLLRLRPSAQREDALDPHSLGLRLEVQHDAMPQHTERHRIHILEVGHRAPIHRRPRLGAEHLVRLTWYVTDRAAYLDAAESLGIAYREVIGRHFPAMSVVEVSALIEPGAVVEIEATAVVP